MTYRAVARVTRAFAMVTLCVTHALRAQDGTSLPPTRGDTLLAEGRWAEAEAAYYQQSAIAPRDPVARAALGRFIAMKGAVRPGMVLIAEARKFGLDKEKTRTLVTPLRAILQWRSDAAGLKRDSTLGARPPMDDRALFQIALPRTDADGLPLGPQGGVSEVTWHDVVDRPIGLDSLNVRGHPIGIEVFEALSPSVDVRDSSVILHANPRSALAATGRRYQVLRDQGGVRVLVGARRVLLLVEALRELSPDWWQLDLPHGVLVVR